MVLKTELKIPKPWGPVKIPENGLSLPLPDGEVLQLLLENDRLQHRVITSAADDEPPIYNVTILGGTGSLTYQPMLPDLSIILRSAHDLRILPAGSMKTLVPVPLVPAITLKIGEKRRQSVIEIPISSISKTWFGDPISGEAAYAMNTQFDFGRDHVETNPWVSLCPLRITNGSHEPLLFKRLALKVPYLSLYAGAEQLYTNELSVNFKGQDQVSQIHVSSKMPVVGESLVKIWEPRQRKDKELIKKSFTFFRSLYSF